MIQYDIFPGGKSHCLTFSYDDGVVQDRRLVEIFNRYGMKGTFHLNSARIASGSWKNIIEEEELTTLYAGHEIACHSAQHGFMDRMPQISVLHETLEDRIYLENKAGYLVRGMSYPNSGYNEMVKETLAACGIVYCRGTKSTNGFAMPEDYLEWQPSCHHKGAPALVEPFLAAQKAPHRSMLFYIWGHSYEFDNDNNWDLIEGVCEKLSGLPDVWYATNIEIYEYKMAQNALRIAADESFIVNPTQTDCWIRYNWEPVYVPAGKTTKLR